MPRIVRVKVLRPFLFLALVLLFPFVVQAQTWSIQAVDVGGARAGSTSLALYLTGGQNYPIVSYFGAPRNLKVGVMNTLTKSWGLARVDAGGEFNSADVDAAGIVHVAYLDGGTGELKYWRLNGSVGSIQLIDTGVGSVNSLRVERNLAPSNGTPHVSYWRANTTGISTPDRLKIGDFNGTSWTPSFADPLPPRGRYNSLALDAAGNAGIAYYDAGPASPPDPLYAHKLWLAIRVAGNWSYDIVDSVGDPGRFNSLQVNASGLPRISYIASSSATLRFAQDTGGGTWGLQDVAGVGTVTNASATSLAIDASGNPHIAYYDAATGFVKYASRSGASTWTVVDVDSVGGGGYCFLRLDTQFTPNRPIISYYDATTQSVRVAYGGYQDIDGDGIPDAYDAFPSDSDHNNNGILDGREGGVSLNSSGLPRLEDEPIFGCGTMGAPPSSPPPADLLILMSPALYLVWRRRARAYTSS